MLERRRTMPDTSFAQSNVQPRTPQNGGGFDRRPQLRVVEADDFFNLSHDDLVELDEVDDPTEEVPKTAPANKVDWEAYQKLGKELGLEVTSEENPVARAIAEPVYPEAKSTRYAADTTNDDWTRVSTDALKNELDRREAERMREEARRAAADIQSQQAPAPTDGVSAPPMMLDPIPAPTVLDVPQPEIQRPEPIAVKATSAVVEPTVPTTLEVDEDDDAVLDKTQFLSRADNPFAAPPELQMPTPRAVAPEATAKSSIDAQLQEIFAQAETAPAAMPAPTQEATAETSTSEQVIAPEDLEPVEEIDAAEQYALISSYLKGEGRREFGWAGENQPAFVFIRRNDSDSGFEIRYNVPQSQYRPLTAELMNTLALDFSKAPEPVDWKTYRDALPENDPERVGTEAGTISIAA